MKKGAKEDGIIKKLNNRQSEWGLDSNAIQEAMERIIEDGADVDGNQLLLFLYAKGILTEENSIVRKVKFNELLEGRTKKLNKAYKRLKTIVIKGETAPTNTPVVSSPSSKSFFDTFVQKHPQWAFQEGEYSRTGEIPKDFKEVNFVVFRDHEKFKGKNHALVERFQKSGLCYMNAPVVLQHYLVAMANEEPIPMLDICQYLKQRMSVSNLFSHIWENMGSDSFDFLKKILFDKLTAKDVLALSLSQLENVNLCELLVQYGPALVSEFKVSKEFEDKQKWCYTGNQPDDFSGMHAMLLVGYRNFVANDGAKKTHFLLQNWWKSKPYVEVDIDFLTSSYARVIFVTKEQSKMGDFPVNENVLVECDVDACEQRIPEG